MVCHRIWVTSHDPETLEKIAQLIDDSAHTRSVTEKTPPRQHQQDSKHTPKTTRTRINGEGAMYRLIHKRKRRH